MSEWEITPRRLCMALLGLLGFMLLPFGGTAAQLAKWTVEKRDAIR